MEVDHGRSAGGPRGAGPPGTRKPPLAIITRSDRMRRILKHVGTIAASDGSVLLIGETGVGKELFADYIHRSSPRCTGPLVKIALSAMPGELLESELFGHERGAYTHAVAEKKGLFELAHRGSLFLDDVDDVPPEFQAKLLRVLESREVLRIGATSPRSIDVRLIAASKVDLKELVDRGLFRADLFYRINVIPVEVPPLRERPEDVPLLVEHFLRRFAPGKRLAMSEAALQALTMHSWPGNVRELRNIVQRVALFADATIRHEDLPREYRNSDPKENLVRVCHQCFAAGSMSLSDVVNCLEVHLLKEALAETKGNRSRAARLLGLSLSTFRDKIRKHELEAPPP